MKLLALETSGAILALAGFEDGRLKAELSREALMRQNESLAPLAAELLAQLGWKASELGAVALSLGPGSFTGLRTGLAFAKGLCFAAGAKLVGVPTLEAWAEGQSEADVWLDARRGMVYRGVFEGGLPIVPVRMLPMDEAKTHLKHGRVHLGDLPGLKGQASAASIGRLALARLELGLEDDPASLAPLYLRRPEAEILWEQRHGA